MLIDDIAVNVILEVLYVRLMSAISNLLFKSVNSCICQ